MAKEKITHTLQSLFASCDEVGSCLEWRGRFNNKSPSVYVDGSYVPARRLVLQLSGLPVSPGLQLGTSCGNWRCICRSHIVTRSPSEQASYMAARVNYTGAVRLAKIQQAARARAIITQETAQQVLLDPRAADEAAVAYKISKSLVYQIRAGKAWKNTSSPWAGLMGSRNR